jgi:hypothetical protein
MTNLCKLDRIGGVHTAVIVSELLRKALQPTCT